MVELPRRREQLVTAQAIAANLRPVLGRRVHDVVDRVDVTPRQLHPVAVPVVRERAGVVVDHPPPIRRRIHAGLRPVGGGGQGRVGRFDEEAEPVLGLESADAVHDQHLAAGEHSGVDAADDRPVAGGVRALPASAPVAGDGLHAGARGVVVAADVHDELAAGHLDDVPLRGEEAPVRDHRDGVRPGPAAVLRAVQHLRLYHSRYVEVGARKQHRAVAHLLEVEAGGHAAGALGARPGQPVIGAAVQPRLPEQAVCRIEAPVPGHAAVRVPPLGRAAQRLGLVPVAAEQQRVVLQADDRPAHQVPALGAVHQGVHHDRLGPGGALVLAQAHHHAGHGAASVPVGLGVGAHQRAVAGDADARPRLVVAVVARNGESLHGQSPEFGSSSLAIDGRSGQRWVSAGRVARAHASMRRFSASLAWSWRAMAAGSQPSRIRCVRAARMSPHAGSSARSCSSCGSSCRSKSCGRSPW